MIRLAHVGIELKHMTEERRLELLVNSIHDYAIYMLDPQGIVSSWNFGAQRLKGYAASEIIGQHYSRFFTEEDRVAGLPQRALTIAEAKGQYEAEGWRIRKDGSRFWVNAVIDPIRDEDGTLLGFAKVTRDFTERMTAQEALRQSEERFRLLVQGVIDYAIFMLDRQGRVTNWNAGAERMKGYTVGEIVGQHFSRFYTDEDRAADVPGRALRTAEHEGRFETEGWRVRKDGGRFWASVVIDAIHNDAGELIGFTKVTRDITERRQMQEALEEARTALFQSQKMEALGQLTGGVAHDFNNLLQVIGGSLEVIEQRLASGRTDVDRHVALASAAVTRATGITQRLLAFARRQPLRPVSTDLNGLVAGMRDLMQRSVGDAIRIDVGFRRDLWRTWVDANQLENALLNLAINARDAMPDGGRLMIEASNVQVTERLGGEGRELEPGDYVLLSVTDTGAGMPADILARAFEPFFTTKPTGHGTGLGLSQLYGFIRQSGGHVRIDSAVGQGTSVKMYLPRFQGEEDEETAEPCSPAVPRPSQACGRGTVLVVEDEALVRMLLVEALEGEGYRVLEADDGNVALRVLQTAERIDLLATDVGLPGINGRQVAEMARAGRPGLKVLFLTGYTYNAGMEQEELGANTQLLTKPVAIESFVAKVHTMLARDADGKDATASGG